MGFPSGTVTLLFTDVEGSIRPWEADGEAMAEASARYDRIVREQVEAAGGRVFTATGQPDWHRRQLYRYAMAAGWLRRPGPSGDHHHRETSHRQRQ